MFQSDPYYCVRGLVCALTPPSLIGERESTIEFSIQPHPLQISSIPNLTDILEMSVNSFEVNTKSGEKLHPTEGFQMLFSQ